MDFVGHESDQSKQADVTLALPFTGPEPLMRAFTPKAQRNVLAMLVTSGKAGKRPVKLSRYPFCIGSVMPLMPCSCWQPLMSFGISSVPFSRKPQVSMM